MLVVLDNFSDFQRKVQKCGQFFPVVSPAFDRIAVFLPPFGLQLIQCELCYIPIGSGVDFFHVGSERFSVFPDHKTAGISDLMNDTDLFGGQREHAPDGLSEAFEVVGSRDQNVLYSSGFRSVIR
jgi:hypothetical protein